MCLLISLSFPSFSLEHDFFPVNVRGEIKDNAILINLALDLKNSDSRLTAWTFFYSFSWRSSEKTGSVKIEG